MSVRPRESSYFTKVLKYILPPLLPYRPADDEQVQRGHRRADWQTCQAVAQITLNFRDIARQEAADAHLRAFEDADPHCGYRKRFRHLRKDYKAQQHFPESTQYVEPCLR